MACVSLKLSWFRSLLSFLNLNAFDLHQFGEVFSRYFFEYPSLTPFFLSSWGADDTNFVSFVAPQLPEAVYLFFFQLLFSLFRLSEFCSFLKFSDSALCHLLSIEPIKWIFMSATIFQLYNFCLVVFCNFYLFAWEFVFFSFVSTDSIIDGWSTHDFYAWNPYWWFQHLFHLRVN